MADEHVPALIKALRRAVQSLTILDAKGTHADITALLNQGRTKEYGWGFHD